MTTPEKIGKYTIERELGHGGMAVVYLARDPHLGRLVAIKMVLSGMDVNAQEFLNRFQNEAKVVATLNHPAIVPIYDYDIHEGHPYLVMQYMPGGSLADRLQHGPLTLSEASRILERIAPALDKVHERNYVHRDLKPSNILFDDEGRPYLADFGLVKSLSESSTAMTRDGLTLGTLAYMSPEQAMGQDLDNRSDIYTLGVILFEMLTGQTPYQTTSSAGVGLAVMHVVEPIPDILAVKNDLPGASQKVINTAMAKNKNERFPSSQALAKEVTLLAQANSSVTFFPKHKTKSSSHEGKNTSSLIKTRIRPPRWVGLAGGLFLLLVIILALVFFVSRSRGTLATLFATATPTPSVTPVLPTETTVATSLVILPPTVTKTPLATKTLIPSLTPTPTAEATSTIPTPTLAPSITEVVVTVDSRQGWQSTGVNIRQGGMFSVEVVGGQWTFWKDVFPYTDGRGFANEGQEEFICSLSSQADLCHIYPMPDFPLGTLIGRINEQLIGIRNGKYNIVANSSGTLELSMNDAHNPDNVGSGIYDNEGVLTVRITVTQ